jgi:error-prone DNA polymerase
MPAPASSYVPLWVKTNGSFLEGASSPEELVERAHALGLDTLAITDRDGVYGLVRAHVRAQELGVRVIPGAQVSLDDGGFVVLLCETRAGYAALCRLLTIGHARAPKGESRVSLSELAEAVTRGLFALVTTPTVLTTLAAAAGVDRVHALITRQLVPGEPRLERALRNAAREAGVATLAGVEVLYHDAARKPLADVVACIRAGKRIREAGTIIRANAEHALASDARLRELFADDLESVERTRELAERCRFSLASIRYRYPGERIPPGHDEASWLRALTFDNAARRYASEGSIPAEVVAQLERELELITTLDYGGYFLTMWEIVQFCGREGILCQGRGSAANSAVCYCLGITAIDPVRMDLLFERFLSLERAEPPDIDLDIEHERREEVIQWVYQTRGRRHAAMVANVIRYRSKSAVRDVGRVLGIDEPTLARLAGLLSGYGEQPTDETLALAGVDPREPTHRLLLTLVNELCDFPRHLSIHPGGFVLGAEPVDELVPVEPATMEGRTVIQWDKVDIEALNLFKVDLLGLGCLTQVRKTFALIEAHEGVSLDLARIPADDPPTFDMLCRADTVGVFQIESRAQMSMLPRLRPRSFYDLVIEVAIVRPGPIQGDMVHPYLRRRAGEERVDYPHPSFERVLARTLGVPIFQEQVMKLAVLAAGYTGGEADQLRRDMAAWRQSGKIERHHDRIVSGMVARGVAVEFAERLFSQIRGFGEYGFPESHAASFALLAYATSYLRRHHLPAFVAGLLNAQPMGFYAPSTILDDAKRHGVIVRAIDVNHSRWDVALEPAPDSRHRFAVRMGYRSMLGFRAEDRLRLEAAPPPYASLEDFVRRTRLREQAVLALAEAGGFDGFGEDRRNTLWTLRETLQRRDDSLQLDGRQADDSPRFEPLAPAEEVAWDYARARHSPRGHPMQALRAELRARELPDSRDVRAARDGARIHYVGLVICRQRPGTASGVTFYTLEDEAGFVNVVVFNHVFEADVALARTTALLGVAGRVDQKHGVTHLIAERLFDPRSADLDLRVTPRSRDFH